MSSTLLSTTCSDITTMLFCLPKAKREKPLAPAIPAVALDSNSYAEVKGGSAMNSVPMPSKAVLGDKVA